MTVFPQCLTQRARHIQHQGKHKKYKQGQTSAVVGSRVECGSTSFAAGACARTLSRQTEHYETWRLGSRTERARQFMAGRIEGEFRARVSYPRQTDGDICTCMHEVSFELLVYIEEAFSADRTTNVCLYPFNQASNGIIVAGMI